MNTLRQVSFIVLFIFILIFELLIGIIGEFPELARELKKLAQQWKDEMVETASKQPTKNELFELLNNP